MVVPPLRKTLGTMVGPFSVARLAATLSDAASARSGPAWVRAVVVVVVVAVARAVGEYPMPLPPLLVLRGQVQGARAAEIGKGREREVSGDLRCVWACPCL